MPNRKGQNLRFAVVGDIHFVQPQNVQRQTDGRPECFCYDTKRYARMAQTVFPKLVAEIAEAKVDFVVQLGDFVQGHRDDQLARKDFEEALRLFETAAPTCVVRGTHDFPFGVFADVVVRHNAAFACKEIDDFYFSFERGNALFILVDTHVHAAPEQWTWLERELARGRDFEHVFVCGHEPTFNVGRPFFTPPDMSAKMGPIFMRHQIDAYFCGHTHNQNITVRQVGDRSLLQAKSSAVGDVARTPVPLDEVRTWLLSRRETAYSWPGYVENSAPGWILAEMDGKSANIEWRRIGDGPHVRIEWTRGRLPKETFRRPFPLRRRLSVCELDQIRRAWLCMCVDRSDDRTKAVTLDGVTLAEFPSVIARYHHRTEIPQDALRLLGLSNELRIVAEAEDKFCVSSVHISAELATGEVVRSTVSPYIYATADELGAWHLPVLRRASRVSELPPIVVSF